MPHEAFHCPNDRIHNSRREPKRTLFIIGQDSIYVYCHDSACVKDRSGTWTRIQFTDPTGNLINFENMGLRVKEMPVGHKFDIEKKPALVEANKV